MWITNQALRRLKLGDHVLNVFVPFLADMKFVHKGNLLFLLFVIFDLSVVWAAQYNTALFGQINGIFFYQNIKQGGENTINLRCPLPIFWNEMVSITGLSWFWKLFWKYAFLLWMIHIKHSEGIHGLPTILLRS